MVWVSANSKRKTGLKFDTIFLMEHGIVLKPEVIGYINFLPVTNTLLVSWIVIAILTIVSIVATWRLRAVPTGLQNFMELVLESGYGMVSDLAGSRTKIFFPFVFTFFIYIILANWIGLLPGMGTIFFKGQPLFRSLNSDLNMTLGLALLSAVTTHFFAIRYLGLLNYLKRWVSLEMFPVFLFVGLLEIVSEFTKVISLSFRLFGNIFAGEVVLATVAGIFAFVLPLPFYFLEIVVGFVQAAVFMMLTLVFMVLLTERHEVSH